MRDEKLTTVLEWTKKLQETTRQPPPRPPAAPQPPRRAVHGPAPLAGDPAHARRVGCRGRGANLRAEMRYVGPGRCGCDGRRWCGSGVEDAAAGNEDGGIESQCCFVEYSFVKMEADKHLNGRYAIEEAMNTFSHANSQQPCNKTTCPNCCALSCYICRNTIRGYEHSNQNNSHQRAPIDPGTNVKCSSRTRSRGGMPLTPTSRPPSRSTSPSQRRLPLPVKRPRYQPR
ncbi:hypothetical protein BJ912DRAFT_1044315 [Pholiota molesta]|nr:hypothetical protein BJ912DRAFT_1044315 [Pholiota molesta]